MARQLEMAIIDFRAYQAWRKETGRVEVYPFTNVLLYGQSEHKEYGLCYTVEPTHNSDLTYIVPERFIIRK